MYRIWSIFTNRMSSCVAPAYNFMLRRFLATCTQTERRYFYILRCETSILINSYVSIMQMESVKRYLILLTVVPIFPRRKTCSIRLRQDRSENSNSDAVVALLIKLSFRYFIRCSLYKLQKSSSSTRANKNNLCRGELACLWAIPSLPQSTHGSLSLHYCCQRHKFSESAHKISFKFPSIHPCGCLSNFSKNTDD